MGLTIHAVQALISTDKNKKRGAGLYWENSTWFHNHSFTTKPFRFQLSFCNKYILYILTCTYVMGECTKECILGMPDSFG